MNENGDLKIPNPLHSYSGLFCFIIVILLIRLLILAYNFMSRSIYYYQIWSSNVNVLISHISVLEWPKTVPWTNCISLYLSTSSKQNSMNRSIVNIQAVTTASCKVNRKSLSELNWFCERTQISLWERKTFEKYFFHSPWIFPTTMSLKGLRIIQYPLCLRK